MHYMRVLAADVGRKAMCSSPFAFSTCWVQEGHSIKDWPLVERKSLLAALLDPAPPNVLVAKHIDTVTADAPVSSLYEHALGLKLEGVVGKLAQSKYRLRGRTTDWFKLKRPGAVPPERFHRKK